MKIGELAQVAQCTVETVRCATCANSPIFINAPEMS